MQAFIVELANQPGSLATVCEALGAGGINITGMAGAVAGSTGSFAFSAEDEAGTRAILGARGWTYREVGLVGAALEHRPGTLAAAARRIADAGVNVETMFATGMDGEKVLVAFGVSDPAAARAALGELAAG
ncbi:MAG: hypothetical protein ACXWWU_03085 [Candidatus Limnocylindria bacterium]